MDNQYYQYKRDSKRFIVHPKNNNKKVVYMGRSEVGGGETCFCEKHGPLRLLRTVLSPS